MPKFENGVTVNSHPCGNGEYRRLRISAGPQRMMYVDIAILEAKLGWKLKPGMTVEHKNGDSLGNTETVGRQTAYCHIQNPNDPTKWCDSKGPGGFMGHTCEPPKKFPESITQATERMLDEAAMKSKQETVNHPAHFGGDVPHEPIKCITAWGLNFALGSAAKYIFLAPRRGAKGKEDLKKAIWYLQWELKRMEAAEADKVELMPEAGSNIGRAPTFWANDIERIRQDDNGVFGIRLFFGHDGHNVCRFEDYGRTIAGGESGRSMQEAVDRCIADWNHGKKN